MTTYHAVKDFEYRLPGNPEPFTVKAGEVFTPPPGWIRDDFAQEHAKGMKKPGAFMGIAFSYTGECINPGEKNLRLRDYRTHTTFLPVEIRDNAE
jgi:hypothetical protein